MNLPGFELQAVIAQSRQSLLRRALRQRDGRAVVLKQPAQQYPSLADSRRLEFEYRILRKLQLPCVIEALELLDDAGRPVLVLEDFGGENLALPPGQRLALSEFFDIALQAARALGEVHARGVVHKDIKPQNMLLNRQTGVLKLIDFQLSSELEREDHALQSASVLEGSLPFISPEQTGRINRSVDYRTDYYALGVTFFLLLTGHLPLEATDILGWIHAHISKQPSDANAAHGVPPGLSRLLDKLMAKDPDDRYQSARGLLEDLEHCRREYRASGQIPGFELGRSDVSERFQVSQRLVGRQAEAGVLLDVFERASSGPAQLLLVAGYSGVGKSSVIREVQRPITRKNGRFVSGKFDQLERNTPYAAVVQAIRELARQLLASPEAELGSWRERLRQALGSNARIMVDLVPELQAVIGPTSAAPAIHASEAQLRFRLVVGQFLRVFARQEHPLVLFLDDLQWTDASTPDLLAELVCSPESGHLLIICAYRENEVQEGHLLPLAVKKVRERRPAVLHELRLEPLTLAGICEICAASLRRTASDVAPLAQLLFEKTSGNPFFATELLAELHRSGAIALSRERGVWQYDLEAVRRLSVSQNVVDLMLNRLAALSPPARQALSVAACVNNQFELVTVAQLLERSAGETARLLWEAVVAGLIVPSGDRYRLAEGSLEREGANVQELGVSYRFQHDRVQDAAYSLIEPEQRAAMHLSIGRRLCAELLGAPAAERPFEIVNHLNLGRALISDAAERKQLRGLNQRAAARAKKATAYAIACDYLDTAVELCGAELQLCDPRERFELLSERVECVLLSGDPPRAAALCRELAAFAPAPTERGAVYLLEARVLEAQARFVESVDAVRSGLALFGITLPADPDEIGGGVGAGIQRMMGHLARLRPEQLLELPDLTDPEKIMAMNLLFQVIPAAIQTFPPLFLLAELIMFDLAVSHGLTAVHAKNFVDCGIIMGGILGDYETAYRLGKVAFQVIERYGARGIASSVNFVFATYVSSWRAPQDEALEAFLESHRAGMETGDIQHVGFSTALRMHRLVHIGHPLLECREELGRAVAFLERFHLPSQRTAVVHVERALARLCDAELDPGQQAAHDAAATARVLGTKNPQWAYAYAESQLVVSVLLGDFAAARGWQQLAEPYVPSAIGLISVPEYHFAEALILTRHDWAGAGEAERQRILDVVRASRDKLQSWTQHCAANFGHKYHLVAGELARLEGAPLEQVLQHYQQAAESTGKLFIHMRALALELQAQLWRERGQQSIARALLGDALELYESWGARVKVRQLRQELGQTQQLSWQSSSGAHDWSLPDTRSKHGVAGHALDLLSVVKATQMISGQVQSSQLFESLMTTLLENAGAQRGCLILCDDVSGELSIEADARVAEPVRLRSQQLLATGELCMDAVHYSARSLEPLVLDDARSHETFANNAYVRAQGVKSILALPILHRGKLVGLFYAENNVTTHAFPPDRVSTLRLIAGQAAISIENARLYGSLESKVEQRTSELASKNREVLAMLDGMDQGVFTIDEELRIQPQYSRQLPALLGAEDITGKAFPSLLFDGSSLGGDARAATEMALRCSFGVTPLLASVNESHLVREFSNHKGPAGSLRHFEVSWNPITSERGQIEKFLVVLRDVTVLRQLREAQSRATWEAEVVTQILSAGVQEFRGFCESARIFLHAGQKLERAGREPGTGDAQRLFLDLHTIKGNARMLGLRRLVEQVHEAESLLAAAVQGATLADWQVIFQRLESLTLMLDEHEDVGRRKLGPLWSHEPSQLESAIQRIEGVLQGARDQGSAPAEALARVERSLRFARGVPLASLLRDAARAMPSLAAGLDKPAPRVECEDDGVALSPAWAKVVRDVLAHAVGNALDHGIEPPAERQARGKAPHGLIRLSTERHSAGIMIRLSDDGRGLALERLRAQATGTLSDEALAERIFLPGVTTNQAVTSTSGRGVGMSAVRRFVEELGGRVGVRFTDGAASGYRPFELVLELPADAAV